MKDINIVIDKKYSEPEITIRTNKKTKEIDNIIEAIKKIDNNESLFISAYSKGKLERIPLNDIIRIRRYDRQVILETEQNSFVLKKTLTKLEEELDNKKFIRISQSEIINAYRVKSMDISVAGTIIIEFDNGIKSYVSRRYVKYVKEFFK